MPLSRYVRPRAPPSGLVLQDRDRQALAAIALHRFLRSDQVHALLFQGVSIKRVQRRLRKLWEHRLLNRHFPPITLTTTAHPVAPGRPYYLLTRRGAAALLGDSHGRASRGRSLNPVTLAHDALVIEFLVALQIACRSRADVRLEQVEPEWILWQKVRAFRDRGGRPRGYLVPDAAVTLTFPAIARTHTFYLEVVRADVRGGNRQLQEKLRRYVALHHDAFFRRVFGHHELRAVIIATTSERRAEHFRQLAGELIHGRRLFWFGSGQEKDAQGRTASTFAPDSILLSRWTATSGQLLSFIPPDAAATGSAVHVS